jgi:hypothetical protein
MRNTLYAVIATCVAMLATSGIVALATAAPDTPPTRPAFAETELREILDDAIGRQLLAVHTRLDQQRPALSRAQ